METECREIKNPNIPEFKRCFYFEDAGKNHAELCFKLIKRVNEKTDKKTQIGLYETRYHAEAKRYEDYDCCWYTGFISNEEKIPFILRFEIAKSDIRILFRFPKKVPEGIFEHNEKIDTNGWKRVSYNHCEKNKLIEGINGYLENVYRDWSNLEKHCQKRKPCEHSRGKITSC
jgi:hypothetical protein